VYYINIIDVTLSEITGSAKRVKELSILLSILRCTNAISATDRRGSSRYKIDIV